MATTGSDVHGSAMGEYITANQAKEYDDYEKKEHEEAKAQQFRDSVSGSVNANYDSTHRKLRPRHIQLIGIGGTIGTALYVQIGRGLLNGGPGSLFLAFTIWYVTTLGGILDERRDQALSYVDPNPILTQTFNISCKSVIGVLLFWPLQTLVIQPKAPQPTATTAWCILTSYLVYE
jgi:hypothetical protein